MENRAHQDQEKAAKTPQKNKRNVEGIYPLSPSQQGMYVESLVGEGSGVHIEQSCWRIRGCFHAVAFEQAWREIFKRHPILRAAIVAKTVEPLQVVVRDIPLPITIRDVSEKTSEQQRHLVKEHLAQVRRTGFNFTKPPLMALDIFITTEDEFYFCWSMHHILLDGWCIGLVLSELVTLYEGFSKGQYMQLPPARPYWDYLDWLKKQDIGQAQDFWRTLLREWNGPTALGVANKEAPPIANQAASLSESIELSSKLSNNLTLLCQRHRVSLSSLCQAAWGILLSIYSEESRVVFGATVSGRPAELPGVQSMVGLFINTLPVLVSLDGNQTLKDFLSEVQQQQVERQAFEYCSTGQIYEWCELAKSASGSAPLYHSILVVENMPIQVNDEESADAMNVLEVMSQGAQTNYPLVLMVVPGKQLQIKAIFHPAHFLVSDIQLILAQMESLFEHMTEQRQEIPLQDLLSVFQKQAKPIFYNAHSYLHNSSFDGDTTSEEYIAPRYDIELTLARIWQDLLGVKRIGVRDNFFSLGGHSLLVLKLLKSIEQHFQQVLPVASILASPTIETMAQQLREHSLGKRQWSPLVNLRQASSKQDEQVLFCLHPLGGNVLCYGDLAQHLPVNWTVIGIQAPGIEEGQEPFTNLSDMSEYYYQAILSAGYTGPFNFIGYSFGGYLAMELAKRFDSKGETIARLVLLDTPAPSIVSALHKGDRADLLASLFPALDLQPQDLRQLDDLDAQLQAVMQHAQAAQFIPPEFGLAEAKRFFAVCEANHFMPIELEPYKGNVSLLRAQSRAERISQDKSLGWTHLVTGHLQIAWVEGEHETMMSHTYCDVLANAVLET